MLILLQNCDFSKSCVMKYSGVHTKMVGGKKHVFSLEKMCPKTEFSVTGGGEECQKFVGISFNHP